MDFAVEGTGSLVSPMMEIVMLKLGFWAPTSFKISNGPYTSCKTLSAIAGGLDRALTYKSKKLG